MKGSTALILSIALVGSYTTLSQFNPAMLSVVMDYSAKILLHSLAVITVGNIIYLFGN